METKNNSEFLSKVNAFQEAVYALAGFMRQSQGRELLKRAAALSMAESLIKSMLNVKKQEEEK